METSAGKCDQTKMEKDMLDLLETPLDLRYCRGLSDKVAQFNKKADQHKDKQMKNPFSEWVDMKAPRPHYKKGDAEYGRPVAGSKTEFRGKKAHTLVTKEILELCEIINENGEQVGDVEVAISFGELFNIYTHISNKVVGMLLRARKHQLVHFEGEVLFQRRDDDVPIFLLKPISEVRAIFRQGRNEEEEAMLSEMLK